MRRLFGKWSAGLAFAAIVAALVGAGVYRLLTFSPLAAAHSEPEQKEGDWSVTPLGKLRFSWHLDKEHRLLVGCENRLPELWDTENGKPVAVLSRHEGELAAADPSPDGKHFVTANAFDRFNDGNGGKVTRSLFVWETESGKFLKRIDVDVSTRTPRRNTDWTVTWQNAGEVFLRIHCRQNPARASVQTTFAVVDVDKGVVTRRSAPLEIPESLVVSPDRKRAVATHQYGVYREADGGIARGGRGVTTSVPLVDMESFKVIGVLETAAPAAGGEPRTVLNAVWSPDGERIATVRSDHTVGIWNGSNDNPVSVLKGHTDWILSVRFSLDSKRIVTASNDATAVVWETDTGKQLAKLTGHTSGLTDAAFDADGKQVVTAGEDQTARLWDARTGKQLRVWPDHDSGVRKVTFGMGGAEVHTQTARGVERNWSAADGSLLAEKKDAKPEWRVGLQSYGVCFVKERGGVTEMWVGPPGANPPEDPPDGRRVVTLGPLSGAGDPRTAGMAAPRLTLKGHQVWVHDIAVAPDGETLASVAEEDSVIVWKPAEWDRVTGRGKFTLTRGQKTGQLAFSPDGKTLATGHADGTIRLWDSDTGKLLTTHRLHRGWVGGLTFLSDDKTLVSAGVDTKAKRFELKSWQVAGDRERTLVRGEPFYITAQPVVSADGRFLAVAYGTGDERLSSEPGEVAVWDLATGKELHRLRGHSTRSRRLAFAPDGRTLASANDDKTARLWDASNGKEGAVLSGHSTGLDSLAFAPDGHLLATGDDEGEVRLWDLATGNARAAFKAHPAGSRVTVLVYSGDGKTLVTGSGDGTVKLWDVEKVLGQPGKK
jgi:WD40 repeat protein